MGVRFVVAAAFFFGGGFLGPRTLRGYFASHTWLAASRRNSAIAASLSRGNGFHSDGGIATIIPSYFESTSLAKESFETFSSTNS